MIRALLVALLISGCGGAMTARAREAAIDKCEDEARYAFNDGKTVREAMDVYDRCIAKELPR